MEATISPDPSAKPATPFATVMCRVVARPSSPPLRPVRSRLRLVNEERSAVQVPAGQVAQSAAWRMPSGRTPSSSSTSGVTQSGFMSSERRSGRSMSTTSLSANESAAIPLPRFVRGEVRDLGPPSTLSARSELNLSALQPPDLVKVRQSTPPARPAGSVRANFRAFSPLPRLGRSPSQEADAMSVEPLSPDNLAAETKEPSRRPAAKSHGVCFSLGLEEHISIESYEPASLDPTPMDSSSRDDRDISFEQEDEGELMVVHRRSAKKRTTKMSGRQRARTRSSIGSLSCGRERLSSWGSRKDRRSSSGGLSVAHDDLEDNFSLDDIDTNQEEPESDSDVELEHAPPEFVSGRRGGHSAEAHGTWNRRRASYFPPRNSKTQEQRAGLLSALQACPFFRNLDISALDAIVEAMPIEEVKAGGCIVRQGEDGDEGFVVLSGSVECYDESCLHPWRRSSSTSFVSVPNRESPPEGSCKRRGEFVRTIPTGRFFGEQAMLWSVPRSRSIYASSKENCVLAKLSRAVYQNLVARREMDSRERRERTLREVPMLETLDDEQIAQIADALRRQEYKEKEVIVKQGEPGNEFFVVLCGECVVTVETGTDSDKLDIQEHRRYTAGDLFGERALLHRTTRAATITASTRVEVLCLNRRKFERMLGPLQLVAEVHYLSDPRKSIADFYRPGNRNGPLGAMSSDKKDVPEITGEHTSWFSVYRPTSRDAMAKMLSSIAVGKGLNVKGKSAKKGRLSGFVPFLQISNNEHKNEIQSCQADGRIRIFYTTLSARETVLSRLNPLLEPEAGLTIKDRSIYTIDTVSNLFGLDVPEAVLREAYIMRSDISFLVGWETGRKSEPAFMDMNWAAVRGSSEPEVVLYQFDTDNSMNPHGLLIAYREQCVSRPSEQSVKPVVSDFDTFTVGSRGMFYEILPKEQQELAVWSLDHTLSILRKPGNVSWNSRWLDVLKESSESGFHPEIPKFGFGDATSYRLIQQVVEATRESGAVRHGAECFNFYFPQELDDNYLVVWEGFPDKPWDYVEEDELRGFLMERIDEGYSFPLNPVWPVRDDFWYELFEELEESSFQDAKANFSAWYPAGSGILERIKQIHEEFPEGFCIEYGESEYTASGVRTSMVSDLDTSERADLTMSIAARSSLWNTVRSKLRCLSMQV